MKYVIIGNSTAAIGCVEGIRSADCSGEIVIISSEPHHTYSRPLISYLLQGKTDEKRMRYRSDDFYKENLVTTKLGRTVTAIDEAAHELTLDNGETEKYDFLMYAAGSSPFVPPAQGQEQVKEAFTFMTLDSALALQKALSPEKSVLIIGAGLIGLKCAEGIFGQCASITVVDLAPRILSSILDEDSAARVQQHLEQQGIRFVLGQSVTQYDNGTATLKNGEQLKFDILVTAVGVRPNTALIKEAGGHVERGIITDEYMKTSLTDIFAAGDCTESQDISADCSRILALLPNAYMQGYCGGKTMAGEPERFKQAIPMNSMGLFGLHIMTAGSYIGEMVECKDKKFFIQNNRLKGYIIIGDVRGAGIYTALIRNETPLDSIDFKLIAQQPSLLAFSVAQRKVMLGGEQS